MRGAYRPSYFCGTAFKHSEMVLKSPLPSLATVTLGVGLLSIAFNTLQSSWFIQEGRPSVLSREATGELELWDSKERSCASFWLREFGVILHGLVKRAFTFFLVVRGAAHQFHHLLWMRHHVILVGGGRLLCTAMWLVIIVFFVVARFVIISNDNEV